MKESAVADMICGKMERQMTLKSFDRMAWIQWISLIGTTITCFVFLFHEIHETRKEVRDERIAQSARTDRLYGMFLDLLKEKK